MDRRAIRLIVRGHVQGVGYRAWGVDLARRLSLDGWARNRLDGSVEILAIGSEAALKRLVGASRRGPPAATVASVEAVPAENDGSVGFQVRPTAP